MSLAREDRAPNFAQEQQNPKAAMKNQANKNEQEHENKANTAAKIQKQNKSKSLAPLNRKKVNVSLSVVKQEAENEQNKLHKDEMVIEPQVQQQDQGHDEEPKTPVDQPIINEYANLLAPKRTIQKNTRVLMFPTSFIQHAPIDETCEGH